MNERQQSYEMIPPECSIYISMGEKLSPSVTEVQAFLVFLAVINIITFPFTVALNALVIIAVKMKSRLRAHKSNTLLACLATTDLLVGVIVQPMYAALIITIVLGEITTGSCALQKLTPILKILLCDTSLIHLALISGERYLAMKHTYAYHAGLVTEVRLLIGSALAWLFPIILHIPLFVGKPLFFVIINNTFIGLCIAVTVFCQITVYHEIRPHEKELSTQQVTEEARQKFLKDKKAFKLTAIIVAVLFLCYITGLVFRVIVMKYKDNMSRRTLYAGFLLSAWVEILNSLLNPLIYSVRMRQFRVAFIELICRTENIAEAEQIEMRWFGSPNAVVRIEAGQQEGDQQNAEQAHLSTNNGNNDILPQNENHIEQLDKNSISKTVQRRHSIGSPNAVVRFEARQQEGIRQNAEQANANINNGNNNILPQNKNYIERLNKNSVSENVQRRHSM